jgi:hypothetical protein
VDIFLCQDHLPHLSKTEVDHELPATLNPLGIA